MGDYQVDRRRAGEWHEYFLLENGEEVAYAKWRMVDGRYAEVHNRAKDGSLRLLRATRREFRDTILPEIRFAGATHAVVGDAACNVDKVRVKYWEFMGFEMLEELIQGHAFAIMEV